MDAGTQPFPGSMRYGPKERLPGSGFTLDPEETFDRLTRLTAATLAVPVSLFTLIEETRQVFKSQFGLGEPWATEQATPLSHSLCQHVTRSGRHLAIGDLRADEAMRGHPAIEALGVVAYLGVPLRFSDGTVFGALCAIDHRPRDWTDTELRHLEDFARIVSDEVTLRVQIDQLETLRRDLDLNNQRFEHTIANIAHGLCLFGPDERLAVANRQYAELYALEPGDILPGTPLATIFARRLERGTDPMMSREDYLEWRREAMKAGDRPHLIRLRDGRTIRIFVNPTSDGGWVAINEDITPQLEIERKIREKESQYKLLATHSGDVIILRERAGKRLYCSPAIETLAGYTAEEALFTPVHEWVHPDDLEAVSNAMASLSASNPKTTVVHRFRRKNGSWIWVEGTLALAEEAGDEPRIVCNIRDVTRRKQAETEYRDLFEHSIIGIYRMALDYRLIHANPALVAMAGFETEKALLDSGLTRWYRDPQRQAEKLVLLRDHGLVRDFQSEVVAPRDHRQMWVSETAWIVTAEDGNPLYIEGMVADITESIASQVRLRELAEIDQLTGLANRESLRGHLDRAMRAAESSGIYPVLVYIDLDRFKSVNDSFGHAAGDELLAQVGRRIEATTGRRGLVARMGGDEFAILCTEPEAIAQLDQLAIQIIGSINQVVHLSGGQRASVGASIGIAGGQPEDTEIDQVKRRADLAMYQAKRDGRNAFRRYSQALEEQIEERQQIELGLREAILNDHFEVHFQPILDLTRQGQSGFEALVRWRHPDGTMISPASFIPIAEENGLIVPIGEFVMRKAMQTAATWPDPLRVAINASVMQLRHPDFMGTLMSAMARTGLAPERIEIEVTESALLDDSPTTLAVLQKLQMLGVRVALDDFGTGWSSLSYLNRHRFDRIKIDRSFVKGISDRRNEAIIRAITDLGNRIGIEITAEGVETAEQLSLLRQMGCHEAQGFLYGKPMPADQTLAFAQARLRLPQGQRYLIGIR
ncbi:MAG: EAL domain-containing protein [Beijerinckiaceae bacterium]|nr:EAL domain-containing protein [Beijerinckiaceae bacterium]